MVAETDVCDSVAGSPRRPDEVLNKNMQVAARCGVAMHNNGDDNDVSERCFSLDLSQTHTRLVRDHTQSQH